MLPFLFKGTSQAQSTTKNDQDSMKEDNNAVVSSTMEELIEISKKFLRLICIQVNPK